MSRFSSSVFFFSLVSTTLPGCIRAEGWPPGHTCDQELPIKFGGMLSMGIPNEDGETFSTLISPCGDGHDYDDDGVPAGGDYNDTVYEYDWSLEGEDEGWVMACRVSPSSIPGSDQPTGWEEYEYQYSWGCAVYWYTRLRVSCEAWEAGTPILGDGSGYAAEDYQYEEDAYSSYCWYAKEHEYPPDW